ncbi:MAG: hypothetical protein HY231_26400 [Acidobacteria bacterium]|nr:hypothetical protein [Acidobacteriota bacterium]
MRKAAEEGYVWEWRAFGALPQTLITKITKQPYRLDPNGNTLAKLFGQDLYLLSPVSDHNLKLRKSADSDWLLKFKLLLRKESPDLELYHESNKKTFHFPVAQAVLAETAELLQVNLPSSLANDATLTADDFVETLRQSKPSVETLLIGKIRSQYEMACGWVELAEVTFPKHRTQSISLHAVEREGVERLLHELQPAGHLAVMNYLEACRRWA